MPRTIMDDKEQPAVLPDPARRSFLKAAPLGALVVAGAATSGAADPAEKRGYHETEHIRRYYQTAAYW
jgi:hypothetical protein